MKHHTQMYKFGEIRERTTKDSNQITVEDNICKMKLYNNKSIETGEAIFHLKYKSEIEKYKWHLDSTGYVISAWYDKDGQHNMSLHGAIIELSGQEVPDGYEIDHKDTNKSNCLDDNLRFCTRSQNSQNVKIKKSNNSGYIGVYWHKQMKIWASQIRVKNQVILLGYFPIKEDAARVYNTAAIKYHGEFAVLNVIK
jgi:hypothetical protein